MSQATRNIQKLLAELSEEVGSLESKEKVNIRNSAWDRLYLTGFDDGARSILNGLLVDFKDEKPITADYIKSILKTI